MKPKEIEIGLNITNNTAELQPVSLFGIVNQNGAVTNPDTEYVFDLSAENFVGVTQVRLNYSTLLDPFPAFTTVTRNLVTPNISGVVEILNSFDVGIFYYQGTNIYVNSLFYQYIEIEVL